MQKKFTIVCPIGLHCPVVTQLIPSHRSPSAQRINTLTTFDVRGLVPIVVAKR